VLDPDAQNSELRSLASPESCKDVSTRAIMDERDRVDDGEKDIGKRLMSSP
jgi:hypothetical protein